MGVDPLLKQFKKLSESLSNDPYLTELGEKYAAAKKELALSIGDVDKHQEAKERLLALENEINSHPALANYQALKDEAGSELKAIAEVLK